MSGSSVRLLSAEATGAAASTAYHPPRSLNSPRIEHVRVRTSGDADIDFDDSAFASSSSSDAPSPGAATLDPADDGFQPFPGMVVMPRPWQWACLVVLAVTATLAFTVLKGPLERVGLSSESLLKYGSIPLISVVFTYVHIWLALWMTFFPIRFVGLCQIPGTNVGVPGWQGIVPFKSEKMARMAVQLMTQRLFDVREIFARLEPERVAAEMGPVLHVTLEEVISSVARQHSPDMWSLLPLQVKREIVNQAHEDAPPLIAAMMRQMQQHITDIFDIEEHVVSVLMRDKALLCQIFIACGYKELSFIRNSGAYMGGLFGLVQMAIWIGYSNKWLLPAFGFVVGTITNWLALKMIFSPVEPWYPCGRRGPRIQGLFLQRQKEVAVVYAKTIARRVLNSKAILASLIAGPATERLFALVHGHVRGACDAFVGPLSKPLLTVAVGSELYERVKEDICLRIVEALPPLLTSLEKYTDQALDMETTLRTKMEQLESREFESLLHPVFEEDEWKLILMGGVLGVIIGFAQIQMLGA